MTTQSFTETIGNLEYYLFPSCNGRSAYAIVNRCLLKSTEDGSLTKEPYPDIVIADTISHDGTDYPVTEIGPKAFSHMQVDSVHVPDSIAAIRAKAFSRSKISRLTGCLGVKIIEQSAFAYCIRLSQELSFPKAEQIGSWAFQYCYTSAMTLPCSLKVIAFTAFEECRLMKKLTMHGSTKITYNPELEIYDPFLHYSTSLRLEPPFTQLRMDGDCLVSADKSMLYHVFDPDCGELKIPGSIRTIVGKPFTMASYNTLIFLNAQGAEPLTVDLDQTDSNEFVFFRPVDIEGLPSDDSVTLHCHNAVRLYCDVEDATIYVYKGANLRIKGYSTVAPLNIIYKEGVEDVDTIYAGTTEIGPDVKKVGRIELDSDYYIDPEEPKYTMTMHCVTPPEIEEPCTKALSVMELRVPVGALDAYAKHPVWKKCCLITDGTTVAVDHLYKRRLKAKKAHMTEAMACEFAKKYAGMIFGPYVYVKNDDDGITLSLRLGIRSKSVNDISYYKRIPLEEAGNPDTWDAIEREVNEIKKFLHE